MSHVFTYTQPNNYSIVIYAGHYGAISTAYLNSNLTV